MTERSCTFSIVFAGDTGVGKTSIVHRIEGQDFSPHYSATVVGSVISKTVDINGLSVRLMVWDTSGTEDFRAMNTTYFHNTQGVVYTYAVDDLQTLEHILPEWRKTVEENSVTEHLNFLAGNKNDLSRDSWCVTDESISSVSRELQCENFYMSALNNEGIDALLTEVARRLAEKFYKEDEVPSEEKPQPTGKEGCGCIFA